MIMDRMAGMWHVLQLTTWNLHFLLRQQNVQQKSSEQVQIIKYNKINYLNLFNLCNIDNAGYTSWLISHYLNELFFNLMYVCMQKYVTMYHLDEKYGDLIVIYFRRNSISRKIEETNFANWCKNHITRNQI